MPPQNYEFQSQETAFPVLTSQESYMKSVKIMTKPVNG